jgi:hypothetical protein
MGVLRRVGFRVIVHNVRPTSSYISPTITEILKSIAGRSQRGELHGFWYDGHGIAEGMKLRHINWCILSPEVVLRWKTLADNLKYRLGLVVANACYSEEGSKALGTGTKGAMRVGISFGAPQLIMMASPKKCSRQRGLRSGDLMALARSISYRCL